jgi:hypothetical protein
MQFQWDHKEPPSINCCNTGINYISIVWWANIFTLTSIFLDLPRLEKLSFPARKFWPTSFNYFFNHNKNNDDKNKNKI